MKSTIGILATMGVLAALLSCYPHTAPTPCANVMNCGNAADYPPLNDDSPINLAGAHAPDAGQRD